MKEKERDVEMHNMEVQVVNALQNSPLNASLLLLQRSKAAITSHIAPVILKLNVGFICFSCVFYRNQWSSVIKNEIPLKDQM